ncbi:MAG: MATE family efflux transporter [Aquificae bacterium]|nr:MATE family efflux transporter [Aquificota bacterium]
MRRILVSPDEPFSSVLKKIASLAAPVVVVNLLYTVENTVSLLLVSSLSASAVAAVGFSLSLLWFVYALMALSYAGTNVLVAQRVGAGKDPGPVLAAGLTLSFLLSLPLFFKGRELLLTLMELLGASETVRSLASAYLKPVFWFIPLGFLTNTFYGAYNGAGDTKTPMKVAVLMNAVHVLTAYALINGVWGLPRLGVEGAGWGVALSEATGFTAYLLLQLLLKKPFPVKPGLEKEVLLRMLRVGSPTALERAVTTLSFNLFVGFLARLGDEVLAAHQIGLRVESFSFMLGFGVMVATTTLVGQNYGAKNYAGAVRAVRVSLLSGLLVMSLGGLLLFLFPEPVVKLFTREPRVVELASLYLRVVALSQPAMALASIYAGALKGLGKTQIPLFVNTFSFWSFRILPSWLLLKLYPSPLVPWGAMSVETWLRGLTYAYFFKREARKLLAPTGKDPKQERP